MCSNVIGGVIGRTLNRGCKIPPHTWKSIGTLINHKSRTIYTLILELPREKKNYTLLTLEGQVTVYKQLANPKLTSTAAITWLSNETFANN